MKQWDVARTLLAVLREGGLTAGAQSLGIDPATARSRLDSLEEGRALLGLSAAARGSSEMAGLLRSIAEQMEQLAGLAPAAGARAVEIEGVVRIGVIEMLAVERLGPLYATLRGRYPRLRLIVQVSGHTENLLRGDADVVVRMFAPEEKALIARRVGAVTVGLWAHRDYVASEGAPANLAELAGLAIVGPLYETRVLNALRVRGLNIPPRDFVLRCESAISQLAAVRDGMGIGMFFCEAVGADPDLVRVLPQVEATIDMFVVMHEDQRQSRAVRAVFDALADFLSSSGPATEGSRALA